MTKVNWLGIVYLLVATLVLFSLGLFFGRVWGKFFLVAKVPTLSRMGQLEASSSGEMADWLLFQHPEVTYSFYYPPTWEIGEEASSSSTPVISLTDPRIKTLTPTKPLMTFSLAEDAIQTSGLEQVPLGTVIARRIVTSEKEAVERYYLEDPPNKGLVVDLRPKVGAYDYGDVFQNILASLRFSSSSPETSSPPISEDSSVAVTLSAQQLGELVQFRVYALSGNEKIEKVRFYANDSVLHELKARDVLGVPLPSDSEELSLATKASRDWLSSQLKENVSSYIFRQHRDWAGVVDSCQIDRGFIHILTAGEKYYDVRLSDDLSKQEICYSSEGIQVGENWYFLWKKPAAGDYNLSAEVHSANGSVSKAQVPNFQVR